MYTIIKNLLIPNLLRILNQPEDGITALKFSPYQDRGYSMDQCGHYVAPLNCDVVRLRVVGSRGIVRTQGWCAFFELGFLKKGLNQNINKLTVCLPKRLLHNRTLNWSDWGSYAIFTIVIIFSFSVIRKNSTKQLIHT